MTHTIHEFDPVLYPRRLWVVVNCPASVLNEWFEDKYEDLPNTTDACVVSARRIKPEIKGGVLIRFESKAAMTTSNIAHEAVHAAVEMFDYVGGRISYDNQEPFAYLVGWVADCIDKVKKGKV